MNGSYLLAVLLIGGIPAVGIKTRKALDAPPTEMQFFGLLCVVVALQILLASESLPSGFLTVIVSVSIGAVLLVSHDLYALLKRN